MTCLSLPTFPWSEPNFPIKISSSSVTNDHFPLVLVDSDPTGSPDYSNPGRAYETPA